MRQIEDHFHDVAMTVKRTLINTLDEKEVSGAWHSDWQACADLAKAWRRWEDYTSKNIEQLIMYADVSNVSYLFPLVPEQRTFHSYAG